MSRPVAARGDTDAPALRLGGAAVERAGTPVVSGVDLTVEVGEWVGVIGPNGAGKTTLLEALVGALPADGTVEVLGADPRRLRHRELARRVALVPQRPAAPAGLTVTDYVLLGRTPYIPYLGVESGADLAVVGHVLERLELVGLADRTVTNLSGGEFQRAVLARALAQQAPVLLLDEPTSALDVGHGQDVLELVDALRRADELTVVAAMHDLTVAGQFADRLLLLDERGRPAALGRPAEVLTETVLGATYGARVEVLHQADGGVVVVPTRTRSAVHRVAQRP